MKKFVIPIGLALVVTASIFVASVDRKPSPPNILGLWGENALFLGPEIKAALTEFDISFESCDLVIQEVGILDSFKSVLAETPFSVVADFNGDQKKDLALVGQDRKSVVLVALTSSEHGYRGQLLERMVDPDSKKCPIHGEPLPGGTLSFVPVGPVKLPGHEEELILVNPGFKWVNPEGAGSLTFFRDGKLATYFF